LRTSFPDRSLRANHVYTPVYLLRGLDEGCLVKNDDDFECNYILDRNLQVGLNVVDEAYDTYPALVRDSFWEDSLPEPLYTAESAQRPINPQVGSCVELTTHEDPFMIHPRRRTFSRASHWDGELEDDDKVPVVGADQPKDNR
ncbi:hypothetical protein COOONC_15508, partial [Cooperia oncophora]